MSIVSATRCAIHRFWTEREALPRLVLVSLDASMERRDHSEPDGARPVLGLIEPIGSLEMSRDLSPVLANIRDSERAAEAWPEALKSMTEALVAAGAACIVVNKNSNNPTGCASRA